MVREVMTPRPDMIVLQATDTVADALRTAVEAGRSRLPVVEGIDQVRGIVTVKDLVARLHAGGGADAVGGQVRNPEYVPEQKPVAELLRDMQRRKYHLAVVLDEHGATAGLVTMEDLIEEIVGEIDDESDAPEPAVERLPDGRLRVPGRTPVDDVAELVGVDLPDDGWETLAGLVFAALGHVPAPGESVVESGHRFTVERMEEQRITSVLVSPEPPEVT